MIIYLISGAEDIKPAADLLIQRGKRVKHDGQVDPRAAHAIRPGKRVIVVAHGGDDGSCVNLYYSSTRDRIKWLWVGMDKPPAGSRIYLYCCGAGRQLPSFLKDSEVFGHSGDVPIPKGEGADLVLQFLNEVETLVESDRFDPNQWREHLKKFVRGLWVKYYASPGNYDAFYAVQLLNESFE